MSKLDTMVKIYNKKLDEEKLAKGSADEILSDIKNGLIKIQIDKKADIIKWLERFIRLWNRIDGKEFEKTWQTWEENIRIAATRIKK
tara:strand:+ start:723 stop:983 length:261 start_codon:yes stop_codon:yes gene_type:complete